MPHRSWSSSIARFALAVLLAAAALQWLHDVVKRVWPTLLALGLVVVLSVVIIGYFRNRDRW